MEINFVQFQCSECGNIVELKKAIMPGDAAVLNCAKCDTSWAIANPSLIIKKTKDLPSDWQDVWKEMSK